MQIIWSPLAQKRIQEILDYIALDDIDTVLNFISFIENQVHELAKNPRVGHTLPFLKNKYIREFVIHKNYSLIYELDQNHLHLLTVRHAKQNIDKNDNLF